MFLELADYPLQKIMVPLPSGGSALVSELFFDKIDDYEFSRMIDELPLFDKSINLDALYYNRARRLGRNTGYEPERNLGKKFGDWFADTGKKIEKFFKPSEGGASVNPDGSVSYTPPKESVFQDVVQGVAAAFGLAPRVSPIPEKKDNTVNYLLLAGGAIVGVVLISKLLKK